MRKPLARPLLWLGHLWAAPVTLFGLAQAVLGGAHFSAVGPEGMLMFVTGPRGLSGRFCRRFHVSAYTWGAVVTFARLEGTQAKSLVIHEGAHLRQTLLLGPLMPFAYGLASLIAVARGGHSYRDNAFEVAARRAETYSGSVR